MYTIKTLNKIANAGLDLLDKDNFNIVEDSDNPEAILVRSASMHEMDIPESLLAIARAGAGTNNIPIDKCSENGVVVFNTPGANANAVKELVIAALLLSSRKIVDGIEWAKTLEGKGDEVTKLVEKGKSQFVGPEILGKKLGVVGLGAIGVMVANTAKSLGMEVHGYDPYLSVKSAWGLSRSVKYAASLEEIFENCDYISIHAPLTDETSAMICKETIATMKDGARILNFSRAGLVSDVDIIDALESGKLSCYVTDFPEAELIGKKGVIAIPHLGASTPESEENCAVMAVQQVKEYIENGNITNSVNLPDAHMDISGDAKICIIHKNVVARVSSITSTISDMNINIENMLNKSKKDYAYTMLDVTGDICDSIEEKLMAIEDVIFARIIKK